VTSTPSTVDSTSLRWFVPLLAWSLFVWRRRTVVVERRIIVAPGAFDFVDGIVSGTGSGRRWL